MFKKIQKYLLLNYPILWNTKVVPVGLIVIGCNILFFFSGFISGSIDFQDTYSNSENHVILFLITGLTSVLTLIVWLVYYLKNNGFKSFYPKNKNSLYGEWLITFILICGICLYSLSYFQGIQAKERSYASRQEVEKSRKLLDKIKILIPESDSDYYTRYEGMSAPSEKASDSVTVSQVQDSVSISLLNFHGYCYDEVEDKQVKKWLIEGQQDSIRNLMGEYLKLQEKHKLTSNLNVDNWMKIIYNPPNFTVSSSNYISKYKSSSFDGAFYYVEYHNLESGYRHIYDAYYNTDSLENFILVILYIALMLSILLFSFRVTSGKSWLIGIVVAGLFAFINGIVTAIFGIAGGIDGDNLLFLTIFYWSALFLFMLIYTGSKIIRNSSKKRSRVMLNLLLWMLPYLPMLYYSGYRVSDKSYYYDKKSTIHQFFDDHPSLFFWINLIFVLIILFFFSKIIKKWRALPEE
jgi:hypothetical protein